MFQVGKVLVSDEVALAYFECDLSVCLGACCVIGDAGAPVRSGEVPALNRAWEVLKDELPDASRKAVGEGGLVNRGRDGGLELQCREGGACVFVTHERGVALCAIQKAFFEGRFDWEKPVSCHLFPIRIKEAEGIDLMNFQYIPSLCSGGAACGKRKKTGLAEFLERPLVRRYGQSWYKSFLEACRLRRSLNFGHDA
jgi:hypothetical protein